MLVRVDLGNDDARLALEGRADLLVGGRERLAVAAPGRVELDELGGSRVGHDAVEGLGRQRLHERRLGLEPLAQARARVDELGQGLGRALALVGLGLRAARREPLERREALHVVLARQLPVRVRVHLRHDDRVRRRLEERGHLRVLLRAGRPGRAGAGRGGRASEREGRRRCASASACLRRASCRQSSAASAIGAALVRAQRGGGRQAGRQAGATVGGRRPIAVASAAARRTGARFLQCPHQGA